VVLLCHDQACLITAAYSYKEYNTPAKLAQLTEVKLLAAGVESKEDRKLVMTALRKSGHVSKEPPRKKLERISDETPASGAGAGPSPSPILSTVQLVVCCCIMVEVSRTYIFST
jgi:hypothetical protein